MKSRTTWLAAAAIAATLVDLRLADAAAFATPQDEIAKAEYRWKQSPHGAMLERILPPAVEPKQFPEPRSEGARLALTYCVQCHYLPNPAMPELDTAEIIRFLQRHGRAR